MTKETIISHLDFGGAANEPLHVIDELNELIEIINLNTWTAKEIRRHLDNLITSCRWSFSKADFNSNEINIMANELTFKPNRFDFMTKSSPSILSREEDSIKESMLQTISRSIQHWRDVINHDSICKLLVKLFHADMSKSEKENRKDNKWETKIRNHDFFNVPSTHTGTNQRILSSLLSSIELMMSNILLAQHHYHRIKEKYKWKVSTIKDGKPFHGYLCIWRIRTSLNPHIGYSY